MPRRIPLEKGNLYHLYNRGVDHQQICLCQMDYYRLISTFQYYAGEEKVPLHAWCVIANHYHLVAEQETETPLSRMMQRTFISYTKYFNNKYVRKGPLFESRFVSKLITSEQYHQNVINYVEQNALRHKIVKEASNWPYSNLATQLIPRCPRELLAYDEEIEELDQLCDPQDKPPPI